MSIITLFFNMKKIFGLSLIEALLTLSIFSIISLSIMINSMETKKKENFINFANTISELLSAIDKRLIIDEIQENNIQEQFSDSNFGTNINLAFASRDHECGDKIDGWQPKNGNKILLLPCNMWTKRIPYNFKIDTEFLIEDERLYGVFFIFKPSKKEILKESSIMINLYNLLSKKVNANMIGTQSYSLIDENGISLNKIECLNLKENCYIKASFNITPMFILQNKI